MILLKGQCGRMEVPVYLSSQTFDFHDHLLSFPDGQSLFCVPNLETKGTFVRAEYPKIPNYGGLKGPWSKPKLLAIFDRARELIDGKLTTTNTTKRKREQG